MIDRLDELGGRYDELTAEISRPENAANPEQIRRLGQEMARLEAVARLRDEWRDADARLREARGLIDSSDVELAALAGEQLTTAERELAAIEDRARAALDRGDPDEDRNAIVEIRPGTGGGEATLFAADLTRMYRRFAERRGLGVESLTLSETGVGGVKEAIVRVTGPGAFGTFRYESGVHRVQRVPATEASGRIHTSAATVAVLPEAEEIDIDIPESDVRVDVFRSSGHGGQSVNTTDSAVRVTHLPTKTMVSIQDEKSQLQNRAKAMAVLRARLFELERRRQAEERGEARRGQIGSGDRSEKIRTYNFPQDRVTDHRIGLTLRNLQSILDGDLDRLVQAVLARAAEERLAGASA